MREAFACSSCFSSTCLVFLKNPACLYNSTLHSARFLFCLIRKKLTYPVETWEGQQSESHHKIRQTKVYNKHVSQNNRNLHVSGHLWQRLLRHSVAHSYYLKEKNKTKSLLIKKTTYIYKIAWVFLEWNKGTGKSKIKGKQNFTPSLPVFRIKRERQVKTARERFFSHTECHLSATQGNSTILTNTTKLKTHLQRLMDATYATSKPKPIGKRQNVDKT